MQINYYIGGIEVEKPLNYAELGIELNFDFDDSSNQSVSITEFEWGIGSQIYPNDASTLINLHRSGGTNGKSPGVFEGLPFRIELVNEGVSEDLFNGYLDTSKALFDCDKVIVTAVESGGIDWINEVFDSKSFKYMQEVEGIITLADYKQVPYVLSSIPNNKEAFLVLISTVFIADTIVSEIKHLVQLTESFTVWPVGGAFIEALAQVVYIASLVVLLVKIINQMIDLLIQPVKYVACMSERKLCKRGAESFGFTFKSSILENKPYRQSYIIPEKYNHDIVTNNNDVDILGFTNKNNITSEGFYKGTFGELLRKLKNKYNAKIIIEGKTLRLEREDYSSGSYNYILPPVDQTDYRLNSEELISNYLVSFDTDVNDKHTIQRYEGVETQTITNAVDVINKDMVLIGGLTNRSIGFARATRKDSLTYAEKIIKTFLYQFDGYVNTGVFVVNVMIIAINTVSQLFKTIEKALKLVGVNVDLPDFSITPLAYSNFGDRIDRRIGMLLMENDFIQVPKNVMIDISSDASNTKISLFDPIFNNSLYLTNNYHVTRSFIPSDDFPKANQYYMYSTEGVPFCINSYNLIKNSNFMQDDNNRDGKVLKCIWYPDGSQTASIDYKINKLYSTNLKENKITPNGK